VLQKNSSRLDQARAPTRRFDFTLSLVAFGSRHELAHEVLAPYLRLLADRLRGDSEARAEGCRRTLGIRLALEHARRRLCTPSVEIPYGTARVPAVVRRFREGSREVLWQLCEERFSADRQADAATSRGQGAARGFWLGLSGKRLAHEVDASSNRRQRMAPLPYYPPFLHSPISRLEGPPFINGELQWGKAHGVEVMSFATLRRSW
jgi:hypothetical protein